jgi:Ferroportin1 (FPN1)
MACFPCEHCSRPKLPCHMGLSLVAFQGASMPVDHGSFRTCAGALMTAYLKWKGMTEATLSVFRGLGALSGLSSTFVFPLAHAKIGGSASAPLPAGALP